MNSAPSPKENKLFSLEILNPDKVLYRLKLSTESNKLEILITNDNLLSLSYKASFQIEDLNKLNRYFRQFDSVEEVFDFLTDLENLQDNIKITKDGKFIKFTISIPTLLKTKKASEIEMIIPSVEVKESDLIIKLCEKVEKIKVLESKINFLFDCLGKNEKDFDFYEKMKDSVDYIKDLDSMIISKTDFATVAIGIKEKLNKKIKEAKLLYRASRDGDSTQFHSKCDGKKNTVTFVKANNGRKFGGFANAAFNSNNAWISDPNAFVFSLDYHECYYYNNNGKMIYGSSSYGPLWGSGNDLYLASGCRSNYSSNTNDGSFNYNGRIHALSGGTTFQALDYETYELILE